MALPKEQLEFTRDTAQQIISKLGIPSEIETEEKEEGRITLTINTEQPGRIIGRKGRSLWYLEYLLNRILGHKFETSPFVSIEVDGYKNSAPQPQSAPKTEETPQETTKEDDEKHKLEKFASDAAKEVKRWGETKSIGPYNSYERQVIHKTLEKEDGITAESDKNAPEDAAKKKIFIYAIDD